MRSRLLARQASQTDLGILEFCLGILDFRNSRIPKELLAIFTLKLTHKAY